MIHPLPLLLAACYSFTLTLAAPYKRNTLVPLQRTKDNNAIFRLGDISYLANTKYPKATLSAGPPGKDVITDLPVTVIYTNALIVTRDALQSTIDGYRNGDDVFTSDFLGGVFLSSSAKEASLDESAVDYLLGTGVEHLILDHTCSKAGLKSIAVTFADL